MPLLSAGKSRFLGGGRLPWYRAGGAPLPVAAYQPKGAASLAASYVNLANPGTYDAAPGVAPTLGASGWSFNGTNQWLTTGIVPASNYSMVVRCAFAGAANMTVAGSYSVDNLARFFIQPRYSGNLSWYANGNNSLSMAYTGVGGVFALAGQRAYLDGRDEGLSLATGTWTGALAIYLGALNNKTVAALYLPGTIAAIAIYSSVLTADQVAAVSAAMAAL